MITTKQALISAGFAEMPAENLTTPGAICLANVSTTAKPVEWLPEAVIGLVKNNGLVDARKFIAPDWRSLTSNTEASYPFFDRAESFRVADYDNLKRALGGEFKYTSQKGERRSVELDNIGLSVALEKSLLDVDSNYRERNAQMLVNMIESATLVEAIAHFEAVATAYTWALDGDVNPDDFVREKLRVAGQSAGVRPNRLLYGETAWDMRDEWLNRQTAASGFNAARDEASLSTRMRADVYVPDARIANGSGLFPTVASDKIYGALAFSGTPAGDVSNVKLLTGKSGGLKVTEWDHPQGEIVILTVSRWQALVTTSDLGAFAITVSEAA